MNFYVFFKGIVIGLALLLIAAFSYMGIAQNTLR